MSIRYISNLVLAVTAGFLVVATQAFGVATATSAVAFVGLGLVGLTAHELTTERVVHSLEVGHERGTTREPRRNGKPVAA
jgi:hypothetical protein